VSQMLNGLSMLGAEVAQGRSEGLHTSGHAYQVGVGVGLDRIDRVVFLFGFCFGGGRKGGGGVWFWVHVE
jgi:hypothetical protein